MKNQILSRLYKFYSTILFKDIRDILYNFLEDPPQQIIKNENLIKNYNQPRFLELSKLQERQPIIIVNEPGSGIKTSSMFCFQKLTYMIPKEKGSLQALHTMNDKNANALFYGSTSYVKNILLPQLGKHIPKSKAFVILNDFNEASVHRILNDSFRKFKLSQLLITDSNQFMRESENFAVYAYHPYHWNGENVQKFNIVGSNLKSYHDFEAKRYHQANGNKLRIFYFNTMVSAKGQQFKNGSFNIDTLGYDDGENLRIFSRQLNFTVEFIRSPDHHTYGYRDKNGTFTGALGAIEYDLVDIAVNGRIATQYDTKNIEISAPTGATKLHFIIPKKNRNDINILLSLFRFFDWQIKMIILICLVSMPAMIYWCDLVKNPMKSGMTALLYNYVYAFAILLSVSMKAPTFWPSRCIVGSAMLVWLVIGNTYNGKMTEFLNTKSGLQDIKTIDELLKSQLQIKMPAALVLLFDQIDESTAPKSHLIIHDIVQKARRAEKNGDKNAFVDETTFTKLFASKKFATMAPKSFVNFYSTQFFDEDGNNMFTYIKESPYEFYIAIALSRTLPLNPRINEVLVRIFEAGINKYQSKLAANDRDLTLIRQVKKGKIASNLAQSISFRQLAALFNFYFCLLGFSFGVLLCEMISDLNKRIHY